MGKTMDKITALDYWIWKPLTIYCLKMTMLINWKFHSYQMNNLTGRMWHDLLKRRFLSFWVVVGVYHFWLHTNVSWTEHKLRTTNTFLFCFVTDPHQHHGSCHGDILVWMIWPKNNTTIWVIAITMCNLYLFISICRLEPEFLNFHN